MRKAYRRRPNDFKRKIIDEGYFNSIDQLYELENKWLNLIKKEELGKKYYNLKNFTPMITEELRKSVSLKISEANKRRIVSQETRKKLSESLKNRKRDENAMKVFSNIRLGTVLTKEHKEKISNSMKNKGVRENNSQYGTCWVYNVKTLQNKKIKNHDLDWYIHNGYAKGRKL